MLNTTALASGLVVAARYELARPLAAGHDPTTWLARDTVDGRDVVLRFRGTDDDALTRISEVVRHPALLSPVASGTADGLAFDVFEYLPGGEIGRLRGRAWTLVARRLLPVADVLAALHDAGWVHGDVKSANVLLDADGLPRLVDFGSARRIGATQAAGASPYSTSPERLDGAPAAPADDVYAFGVLLYELVSGHPPFYPDITPARVREEIPAPLDGRPSPPAALRDLVARCLAKQPDARPVSMRDLRLELAQAIESAAAAAPVPEPGAFQPRPPADALPLPAQWRRTSTTAPSPQALRSEGFRRGLFVGALVLALAAAGFTFFVLPGLVAPRTPAPAAAPVAKKDEPAAAKPLAESFELLAEQKRLAEARREPLPGRLQQLEGRDVASWGGVQYTRVRNELAAGDAAMTARDFVAARARFDAAAIALDALDKQLPAVIAERKAAARAAFDAGRAAEATEKYAAVLKVAPADADARTGLARSKVLDAVVRETAAGARAEQEGNATAALAAFARKDYAAAQAAYEKAGRIRPGTPEVAEGLQQIRRVGETRDLAGTLQRAAAAESAEQWSQALALYGDALKIEPALRAAQEGVERAEPRAMIDAELQSFLDKPERLYSPAGRDIARNVLERAARFTAPGPHLRDQQARLAQKLREAETPIVVALASDNATDVQIYRVGKLGLFEQRSLELMPGRYTVVGTRQGYRDVRKELNLLPGAAPPTLVVRCEEPI